MPKKKKNKRYVFIDVYNTINTAEQLCGFSIDWKKLYNHLIQKWQCDEVYFYDGVEMGDTNKMKEYNDLKSIGYIMRTKTTMIYKNSDRKVSVECDKCGHRINKNMSMGYCRKSNCDVELTLDVAKKKKKNNEFLLMTGDGDFEYLINYLIDKDADITLISNTTRNRFGEKRCSSKLKMLFKQDKIRFIDIKTWKKIISID